MRVDYEQRGREYARNRRTDPRIVGRDFLNVAEIEVKVTRLPLCASAAAKHSSPRL
jgi:hypothetical protein